MDPLEIASSFWLRYGTLATGLIIGLIGRYGMMLDEKRPLSPRVVIADLMMMGLVGLIVLVFSETLGLTGNARVMVAALAMVCARQVIRGAVKKFLKRFDDEVGTIPETKHDDPAA